MRGYFGIAVYHPKTEANIGTLWRSAFNYRAGFIATVGSRYRHQASDTTKAPGHVPLLHYAGMEDMIEHLPFSCPLVGVELTNDAEKLNTFIHPQSCLYLLGAEDYGLPPSILKRCHKVIVVPGAAHCLNVAVAGSIVMYDRWIKRKTYPEYREWYEGQTMNRPIPTGCFT